MTPVLSTRPQAKAYARILRARCLAEGQSFSHAQALERVAKQLGHTDWNTLCATLPLKGDHPLEAEAQVAGYYLKQPFTGKIKQLEALPGGESFNIVVDFDEPVDVVAFASFSNTRRRITARIAKSGISYAKTSDGAPHLLVSQQPGG